MKAASLVIAAGIGLSSPASAEVLSGPATVIDGDTLTIGDTTVRLYGIDAPELDQTCQRGSAAWPCGSEVKGQLAALVAGQSVACAVRGVDDFGRSLAVCHLGYLELNSLLVEEGWATAFRRYSIDYLAEEARARTAKKGIWASDFMLPEYHRLAKAERQPAKRAASLKSGSTTAHSQHDGSCTIKGNRNRRGEWIYHLPGMPYYDATRPEEIFCSEAAAQAAGYRRSRAR